MWYIPAISLTLSAQYAKTLNINKKNRKYYKIWNQNGQKRWTLTKQIKKTLDLEQTGTANDSGAAAAAAAGSLQIFGLFGFFG